MQPFLQVVLAYTAINKTCRNGYLVAIYLIITVQRRNKPGCHLDKLLQLIHHHFYLQA